MAKQSPLAARRAAVKAMHQAAARKVARNERDKGVKLTGTKYDPRRDIRNVERYTAKQLDAYERELSTFNSRKTQFVPDAKGRPLPAAKYRVLAGIQRKINAGRLGNFDTVKDIKIPGTGMTIGEADAAYTPNHPMAGNPAVLSPRRQRKTDPKRIPNEKALDKLIAKERQKLAPDYAAKQEKRDRWNVRQVAKGYPKELQKIVNSLNSFQFNVLYNGSKVFMTALATSYAKTQKSLLDGRSKAFYNTLHDNSYNEALALAKWAKTL